ncbi:PR-1-like protein [Rhizodiscina lignyota]|uniref:PR-1-like protein n=1 Tax=Rhizodiscina lignyota TaxID=1504668 RepID=A0A9P4IFM6_9PEZI|nr:PR-1-like protein [Rhizodiscina lignyota]
MRYSLLAGALIAGVSASPVVAPRDVVTVMEYATQVVTVTAGPTPAPTVSEVSVAAVPSSTKWWHWHWSSSSSSKETPAPAPATTAAPKPKTTTTAKPKPKTTTTAKAAASTPSSSGKPSYSEIVVMHHNIHRANHSADNMEWDQSLADTALAIAQSCNYAHNVDMNGGGYGQNIAAGAPSDNISSIITDHFYNDEAPYFIPFYNQATPSDMSDAMFDKYGHFTQIVWKGSNKVGCATYDCSGHGNGPNGLGSVAANVPPYFTVCNYGPPGNYLGEFNTNVSPGEGKPEVNWSWGM